MALTSTEKLLRKNFGIQSFNEVIAKLEKEPEETFRDNLFTEKSQFIDRIKQLNETILLLSDTYSAALDWRILGSTHESLARNGFGSLKNEYIKVRKQMVHHLSFFYKLKH
jgi:hypothetical protein